ncbi:unnamed protein product [Amoebophrya sp. A120]|nr:unnamed protein product [Amoebophrya sp. A120]|eukprot:GSA120T00024270001.1
MTAPSETRDEVLGMAADTEEMKNQVAVILGDLQTRIIHLEGARKSARGARKPDEVERETLDCGKIFLIVVNLVLAVLCLYLFSEVQNLQGALGDLWELVQLEGDKKN